MGIYSVLAITVPALVSAGIAVYNAKIQRQNQNNADLRAKIRVVTDLVAEILISSHDLLDNSGHQIVHQFLTGRVASENIKYTDYRNKFLEFAEKSSKNRTTILLDIQKMKLYLSSDKESEQLLKVSDEYLHEVIESFQEILNIQDDSTLDMLRVIENRVNENQSNLALGMEIKLRAAATNYIGGLKKQIRVPKRNSVKG
ncbi:hypothetical protein OZX65_00970 [Leuconostocaceae bacterium ESL0723]|nr:hypothetical protein OZX65_00970 [Leuconostocaceae bacterium ESL0723]